MIQLHLSKMWLIKLGLDLGKAAQHFCNKELLFFAVQVPSFLMGTATKYAFERSATSCQVLIQMV